MINNMTNQEYYKIYLEKYNSTTAYIKKRGGAVRPLKKPLNYYMFNVDFISEQIDNPGKDKKHLALSMAKNDAYTNSWKRAEKLAEAHVAKFGGKVSMNLIHRYQLDVVKPEYDEKGNVISYSVVLDIERRREELKKLGISKSDIMYTVGQEFFGST